MRRSKTCSYPVRLENAMRMMMVVVVTSFRFREKNIKGQGKQVKEQLFSTLLLVNPIVG